MRTLVTGGAGFIGGHLVRALLARGDEVVVYDSFRTGKRANLAGLDCRIVEGDIADGAGLRSALTGCEQVFHLAAQVSVPESVADPALSETINLAGTRSVLEAARAAGVRKVVYASTCAAYGSVERPVHRETDVPQPESPYALTKFGGECYVEMYRLLHGMETASMRFFNVYGPRQDPSSPYAGVVTLFAERAMAGRPLTIFGDGGQSRDFISVHDIVSALITAGEKGSGIYNVCTQTSITVSELAEMIRQLVGSSSAVEHAPARQGDVRHSRGTSERLRALGWEPRVALGDGLRETLDWIRSSAT